MAKEKGMVTIGMTGAEGTAVRELADYAIRPPPAWTRRIQEAHIVIGHIICEIADGSFTELNLPS